MLHYLVLKQIYLVMLADDLLNNCKPHSLGYRIFLNIFIFLIKLLNKILFNWTKKYFSVIFNPSLISKKTKHYLDAFYWKTDSTYFFRLVLENTIYGPSYGLLFLWGFVLPWWKAYEWKAGKSQLRSFHTKK